MSVHEKQIDLLGYPAKDKVTEFKGIIECVSFDLYGCVQATLRPRNLNKDGEVQSSRWFDVSRLDVNFNERVLDLPNFNEGYVAEGKKGAAEKPMEY